MNKRVRDLFAARESSDRDVAYQAFVDLMTLAEKLETMELLWADISRQPADLPSPAVYYLIEDECVDIYATLDCRRDPEWIAKRLDSSRNK